MNEASILHPPRQALLLGAGLTAGAVLSGTGTAAAAGTPGTWNRPLSANIWPVVDQATRQRVEGTEKVEISGRPSRAHHRPRLAADVGVTLDDNS
ncbi:hypothetical protein ACWCPT_24960 [Streptomyces sp. NPDC002308]